MFSGELRSSAIARANGCELGRFLLSTAPGINLHHTRLLELSADPRLCAAGPAIVCSLETPLGGTRVNNTVRRIRRLVFVVELACPASLFSYDRCKEHMSKVRTFSQMSTIPTGLSLLQNSAIAVPFNQKLATVKQAGFLHKPIPTDSRGLYKPAHPSQSSCTSPPNHSKGLAGCTKEFNIPPDRKYVENGW